MKYMGNALWGSWLFINCSWHCPEFFCFLAAWTISLCEWGCCCRALCCKILAISCAWMPPWTTIQWFCLLASFQQFLNDVYPKNKTCYANDKYCVIWSVGHHTFNPDNMETLKFSNFCSNSATDALVCWLCSCKLITASFSFAINWCNLSISASMIIILEEHHHCSRKKTQWIKPRNSPTIQLIWTKPTYAWKWGVFIANLDQQSCASDGS